MKKKFLLPVVISVLCGCARHPIVDDGKVSSSIKSRVNAEVFWNFKFFEDQVNCHVQNLLENELEPESAIQIALLQNPKIQALFDEIGIAHADLIEAGLFSNPNFSLEIRYPQKNHLVTNVEYLVTQAFLDIFLIPLKKKVATIELERVKRKVTDEILDLVFAVRKTYYELLYEELKLQSTHSIVELTDILNEIVSRQNRAGNVNELQFQKSQVSLLEAKLELANQEVTIISLKEKFIRLLGLKKEANFILPATPLRINEEDVDVDLVALETIAIDTRLDLQVAGFEIIRLKQMLGLKKWWSYTDLMPGLAGEREASGANLVGFGLTGVLPIFNYGQAARMRLCSELGRAQNHYLSLETEILSEVREAYKLLRNTFRIMENYQATLMPSQIKISITSEELYNVMGIGIDNLLENKRQEFIVLRNYQEAIKNYFIAKNMLDKSLGGYLYRLLMPCQEVERS